MPADNCAFFGCESYRRVKRIGIWKLPATREMESGLAEAGDEITKTHDIDLPPLNLVQVNLDVQQAHTKKQKQTKTT